MQFCTVDFPEHSNDYAFKNQNLKIITSRISVLSLQDVLHEVYKYNLIHFLMTQSDPDELL